MGRLGARDAIRNTVSAYPDAFPFSHEETMLSCGNSSVARRRAVAEYDAMSIMSAP